ncbi:MAG: zinc ribbon domain-containing protein [Candidatus Woesearchaeota archaeon]
MKIPGIAYILIGLFMSGLSGYIYRFVPKPDGTPNMSMTFFFFIGIIFIIIGFIKIFFKSVDKKSDLEYQKIKTNIEKQLVNNQEKNVNTHKNRVEEQLKEFEEKMKHTQKKSTQNPHTNTYAKTHQYTGVKNPGIKKDETPKINNFMTLKCKRCGKVNPSTAYYCHDCGYRLN